MDLWTLPGFDSAGFVNTLSTLWDGLSTPHVRNRLAAGASIKVRLVLIDRSLTELNRRSVRRAQGACLAVPECHQR